MCVRSCRALCQGPGILVNLCDEELSTGFSRRLPNFKISLIAQGRMNFMGTGVEEDKEVRHPWP